MDNDVGLSYFRDQKLDMRLDRTDRPSASQILNWSNSTDLNRIFKEVIICTILIGVIIYVYIAA